MTLGANAVTPNVHSVLGTFRPALDRLTAPSTRSRAAKFSRAEAEIRSFFVDELC